MPVISRISRVAAVMIAPLLAAGPAPAQEPETIRQHPYLVAAGDLDADGGTDGLAIEYTRPVLEVDGVGGVVGYERIVTGRSGRDGSVLWSLTGAEGTFLPAPLGPGGGDGLLEYEGPTTDGFCECSFATWADEELYGWVVAPVGGLDLRARGGDGADLWTRSFAAASGGGATMLTPEGEVAANAYSDRPALGGLMQAVPGAAEDPLVVLSSRQEVGDDVEASVRIEILDGRTGETATAWTVTTHRRQPVPARAGDLDGDGLDDVVVANDPGTGDLSAYRSSDGGLLWRNEDVTVERYFAVRDPSDLDGDGRDELQIASVANIFVAAPDPTAHVLDGSTGQALLSEPGGFTPVGDLEDDDRIELAHVTTGPQNTVTYRLIRLTGEEIAARTYTHEGSGSPIFDGTIGDLDGDGVFELGHRTRFSKVWEGTAVDGRTLEPVFEGPTLQPMRASLDGAGDDFVGARVDGRELVVTAQDGADGSTLWERRLPFGDHVDALNVFWHLEAADLAGDGTADVLVNGRFPPQGDKEPGLEDYTEPASAEVLVWALAGDTGATLWSL